MKKLVLALGVVMLLVLSCSNVELLGPENLSMLTNSDNSSSISIKQSSNGSIDTLPSTSKDSIVLVFKAENGFTLDSIYINGEYFGSDDTLTIAKNGTLITVEAKFKPLSSDVTKFRITLSKSGNGSITPNGSFVDVDSGKSQVISFIPQSGSELDFVEVDGAKVDSLSQYTFKNVEQEHTFHVQFKIKSIAKTDTMVLIHAKDSQFVMGVGSGDTEHTVGFTHDFYMDQTEVTQGVYDSIMTAGFGASGYSAPVDWASAPGKSMPAYSVNWYDAILFCNARSLKDGFDPVYTYNSIEGTPGNNCRLDTVIADYTKNGYRLPTEAEWEYACRAGSSSAYSWGDSESLLSQYAVYEGSNGGANYGMQQVASKKANSFGLFDMNGNLWEWCYDRSDYYKASSVIDPIGPNGGEKRVCRGGFWNSYANELISSYRNDSYPDVPNSYKGFRTVRN